MLTSCNLTMFISKLSECKQAELYADFIADFANVKSFCSTWMVLAPFYAFSLSLLKLCYNALSFSISMSWSSLISIKSPFLSFRVFPIVSVVPLSLVAFIASSCSSLSCWILKRSELFRVARLGLFCPCVLENQSLGSFLISDPVLHH